VVQVLPVVQALPVVQVLPVAQAVHAVVPEVVQAAVAG
jgi:hypothetical protein